jgi:hypothetical protein
MQSHATIDWKRLTTDGLASWLAGLKVGDRVGVADMGQVQRGDASVEVSAMTVVKLTPTGQICVEQGNGARFIPPAYRGTGRWRTHSLYPLVEEEAAKGATAQPPEPTSPHDATITVIASPVRVTQVDGWLMVQSPYNEDFVVWAKLKKGRYTDKPLKIWALPVACRDALRAKLLDIYGVDGLEREVRAVDVRIALDEQPYKQSAWWFLGREVAWRQSYNWPVKTDGVVVIEGGWLSAGGDRDEPRVTAEPGTIIELRGVPLGLALKVGDARGWVGMSLVKRGEGEQIKGARGQSGAQELPTVSEELPELYPFGGREVELGVRLKRQRDLCELSAVLDVLKQEAKKDVSAHERRLYNALFEGAEALRTAMMAQPYLFWHSRWTGGEPLEVRIMLWMEVAAGGYARMRRATEDTILPAVRSLLAAYDAKSAEQAPSSSEPVDPL